MQTLADVVEAGKQHVRQLHVVAGMACDEASPAFRFLVESYVGVNCHECADVGEFHRIKAALYRKKNGLA